MTMTRRKLLTASTSLAVAAAVLPTLANAAVSANNIKPQRLRPGMTVGLVTPASNVPEDQELHIAMDLVRSLGFSAKP